MERLDRDAIERIRGAAWDGVRPQFEQIHEAMIGVSPAVSGELTTIYIKYGARSEIGDKPFAVLWIKSSKQLVLGLALPDGFEHELLREAPPRHRYSGLTKYLVLGPRDSVPKELSELAKTAFDNARQSS